MKKILTIFLFAISAFGNEQPVKLAARTVVREGKLDLGVRNNTGSNISGVIKFAKADGVELLVNGFGFDLAPEKTIYKSIPIKNATKDMPTLTCDVIVFNKKKSKLYENVVKCKSGAMLRNVGAGEMTAAQLKPAKIKILRGKGLEKNFFSFYFQNKRLIRDVSCHLGNFQIEWGKINTKNKIELTGKAFDGLIFTKSNIVADVKLSIKQNERGDCMIVFSYTLLKQLPDEARNPYINLDIPRAIAENDLVTLKYNNGKVELALLDNVSDPALVKKNKNIDEFSVITKNDWMTFYLDSSYLNVWNILLKTTPDKQAGLIRLRIKSRVEWKPPFLPTRSGTIQFFIHFPVGAR